MSRFGITRVANVTHLDRIGVPVVAVYRPNARSLSVAQGKGCTLVEAKASGLMESIESYHAEHIDLPLRLDSHGRLRQHFRVADVAGLPRLTTSTFHQDDRLLWVGGTDLMTGKPTFVPFETVHTDFRLPLPEGGGAFLMSSNGLASGNHPLEATSHAICEVVERDATTLWSLLPPSKKAQTRVDLSSVDDARCLDVLAQFENAGLKVGVWNTTSDTGIASCYCTIVDRDPNIGLLMSPSSGAGCHPRRRVALLRALTEAAQSRLTVIAGARDDVAAVQYDAAVARESSRRCREELASVTPYVEFHDIPDVDHASAEADVHWELEHLASVGLKQAVLVDLTRAEYQIPVVRMVIPHLESLSGIRAYVLGKRARSRLEEKHS
jgi:ribosomal protein S12 methylthiotransferase accessory factor